MSEQPVPPEHRPSSGWDYPPSRLTKFVCVLLVGSVVVIGLTLYFKSSRRENVGSGRLPIEQIAKLYHDDPDAAEARYGFREIHFQMKVDEIVPTGPGLFIVVQRQPGEKLSYFGAVFDHSCLERLNRYEKGAPLRGRGRFMHAVNGIVLDNCTLED